MKLFIVSGVLVLAAFWAIACVLVKLADLATFAADEREHW